jgi:hypothetical protein
MSTLGVPFWPKWRWRSAKSFGAKEEEDQPVVSIMILSSDKTLHDGNADNNALDIGYYGASCGSEIRN